MSTYVGAARWTGGTLGGVFRRHGNDPKAPFERLAGGLPEDVHVQAITVHPREPGVVYVGAGDGVYRTDDGGTSWRRLPTPAGLQIWSVAIDSSNPRVVYAGTSPVGILKSEDAGESWRQVPPVGMPQRVKMSFACRVMRIAIDAANPQHLFAALEVGGVMRSRDGGVSWEDCAAELAQLADRHANLRSRLQSDTEAEGMLDAHAICVSAAAPATPIVALRMGLFKSSDAGAHWEDMAVGRFSPLTYARDIRASPHDPRVLVACLSPAAQSKDGSVYRSDDLGTSWRRLDHGVRAQATMMAVTLDPRDARGVHCVSRCGQVFSTVDGGESWHESRLPEGVKDTYAIAHG
jgi:photosystem II stability/assembly factor-like uncharacterized protein